MLKTLVIVLLAMAALGAARGYVMEDDIDVRALRYLAGIPANIEKARHASVAAEVEAEMQAAVKELCSAGQEVLGGDFHRRSTLHDARDPKAADPSDGSETQRGHTHEPPPLA